MGVTIVTYACGHSTRNSNFDRLDTEYVVNDSCISCFKSTHRLLQEGESLSQFVTRKTSRQEECKPVKRWGF